MAGTSPAMTSVGRGLAWLALRTCRAIFEAMSSLRMPQGSRSPFQTGANILDIEIQQERSAALCAAGQRIEKALATLREFDASGADMALRPPILKEAATAVWYYFIQREACGIRDQRPAIEHYAIPREVLMRLGAR